MLLKEKSKTVTKKKRKENVAKRLEKIDENSDMASIYEESLKVFEEGQVVKGTIVTIQENEVLVDIGYKSEGIVPLGEFSNSDAVKVGDEVDVLFEASENEAGMIVISKRKADRIRCWDEIIQNFSEGSDITGKIFKKVRGGFMVDIGMEAFLPASLVDIKPTKNLDQFLGMECDFKIAKINFKRKNIVLSRKARLDEEKKAARGKILDKIDEGQLMKGRVKNITDFGAFIDLGGVDGLLHITDMSWGRVSHPSELVSIGDELEVIVIGFDKDSQKVSLGLKQKAPNPWEEADTKYPVNAKVKGRVVNILPYGAFIELEKGIEGLVHISELSWTKRINHPSEMLTIGDEVEAIILSIDKDGKKIALGMKQTEVNPWLVVDEKYPVDSEVEGVIRNITDYGAFVELEPGIDGLVHVSDISWNKKAINPKNVFKKGDTIKAKILSVDKTNRKISLGVKQLTEDPWDDVVSKYPIGDVVKGKITKVVNFGIFVDIDSDIEGLIHVSEVPENKTENLESNFQIGDELEVMILKIDNENRKVALTLKGETGGSSEESPEV